MKNLGLGTSFALGVYQTTGGEYYAFRKYHHQAEVFHFEVKVIFSRTVVKKRVNYFLS